jgi:hypothetical protein
LRNEMIDIAWRCESRILYAMLALHPSLGPRSIIPFSYSSASNFFFGTPFFAHALHCPVFASWAIAIHSFHSVILPYVLSSNSFFASGRASASWMLLGALLFLELQHQYCPNVHVFDARETTVPQSNGLGSSGVLIDMIAAANPGAPRSK